jgi:predicted DCC family thiol-disulfide oxidoreductase YuxK
VSRLAAAADRWIFESFAGDRLDLTVFRVVYASWMLLAYVPRKLGMRGIPDFFFSPPLGPVAFLDGFPPDVWLELLNVALVAALVLLLFGYRTRAASLGVAVLLLCIDAWAYATGKITHTILVALVPAALAFSSWGASASVDARRGRASVPPGRDTWLLALLALLVGLAFFTAGIVKLGAGWLDPDTHATYGYAVGRFFTKEAGGTWLAGRAFAIDSHLVWEALDWAAVGFELSFVLAVFSRRTFSIYCALACLFHLGVRLLLGINFEQNLIAYAAFVRWSALPWPRGIRAAAGSLATGLAGARPVWLTGAALALGVLAVYGIADPPLHLFASGGREGGSLPTQALATLGALLFLSRVLWPAPRAFSPGAPEVPQPLVLFDGVCGLCNRFVDFVLARDRGARLRFAPLQSEHGRALLAAAGLDPDALDSVVLVRGGRAYRESAAALRVLAELGLPWSLCAAALAIPAPLRDAVYRFVARNRYAWFGLRETCRLPTPEERTRFLA